MNENGEKWSVQENPQLISFCSLWNAFLFTYSCCGAINSKSIIRKLRSLNTKSTNQYFVEVKCWNSAQPSLSRSHILGTAPQTKNPCFKNKTSSKLIYGHSHISHIIKSEDWLAFLIRSKNKIENFKMAKCYLRIHSCILYFLCSKTIGGCRDVTEWWLVGFSIDNGCNVGWWGL